MKTILIRLMISFTVVISFFGVTGCGKQLPEFPQINQCSYSWKYKKFRCTDTKTHVSKNVALDDPSMEGAQAMSLRDFDKSEAWVNRVADMAKERCN